MIHHHKSPYDRAVHECLKCMVCRDSEAFVTRNPWVRQVFRAPACVMWVVREGK